VWSEHTSFNTEPGDASSNHWDLKAAKVCSESEVIEFCPGDLGCVPDSGQEVNLHHSAFHPMDRYHVICSRCKVAGA
jgi:hypothetical protein